MGHFKGKHLFIKTAVSLVLYVKLHTSIFAILSVPKCTISTWAVYK